MNAPKIPDAPPSAPHASAAPHAGQHAPNPELRDTRTHENLRAAFAVDAQAVRMWEYFGRIAEIEGYPDVARTFRELAESQAVNAHGHLDFLMRAGEPLVGLPLGETAQNVRAAVAVQQHDAADVLPDMARTARAEGFMDIASWFDTMVRSRKHHEGRLTAALAGLKGSAS
ncbi:MAG: rubrerythrin family protein [Myxococcota bacterium]